MNQTRLGSLIESVINVVIGFAISFTANMLIFPMFGFHLTARNNLAIGLIYTIISVVRSYCIRRWFNAKLHTIAEAAATAISRN